MRIDVSEKGFETNIEASLIGAGYHKRVLEGEDSHLFKEHAIDIEELFAFLEDTQPQRMRTLKKTYGADYQKKYLSVLLTR